MAVHNSINIINILLCKKEHIFNLPETVFTYIEDIKAFFAQLDNKLYSVLYHEKMENSCSWTLYSSFKEKNRVECEDKKK